MGIGIAGDGLSSNPPLSSLNSIADAYTEHFIWIDYNPAYFNAADESKWLQLENNGFYLFKGRTKEASVGAFTVTNVAGSIDYASDHKYVYAPAIPGKTYQQGDYIVAIVATSRNQYVVKQVYVVKGVDDYTWANGVSYFRLTCKVAGIDVTISPGDTVSVSGGRIIFES